MSTPRLEPESSIFFLCDVQTKFRTAIHGYDQVVATANKLVKLAKILDIPVLATTQNTRALGPIDPAIDIQALGPLLIANYDKTLFSMLTPDVKAILDARPSIKSIIIFGIESHVCVLQTVLSSLQLGKYAVHVVADGISSCNAFEVPIAVERMRSEGAIIGTSESIAFQLMADAGRPNFKAFSQFIKEEKDSTRQVGEVLLQGRPPVTAPSQPLNQPTNNSTGGIGGVALKSAM